MTVEVALAEEEALFRSLISKEVQFQLGVKGEELDQMLRYHYQPGNVTAIHVLSSETEGDETPHRFIVSRPVACSLSVAGRGTRGFWAVDMGNRSVVFLKDAWRSHSVIGKEGDALCRLNNAGVRNVPTLITHGDVPHVTQDIDPLPSREFDTSCRMQCIHKVFCRAEATDNPHGRIHLCPLEMADIWWRRRSDKQAQALSSGRQPCWLRLAVHAQY